MRIWCWFVGHAWVTRHRKPLEPIDNGGWGFLGPDPTARLFLECSRCPARDVRTEYPQENGEVARWLRGEELGEVEAS